MLQGILDKKIGLRVKGTCTLFLSRYLDIESRLALPEVIVSRCVLQEILDKRISLRVKGICTLFLSKNLDIESRLALLESIVAWCVAGNS